MTLKPYPAYKPSGVEWLGDVPEGWEVKRLKYSATINDETLPETTDPEFEFKYVDIGGVNAVDGITATETMGFETAPSRAGRKGRHGDTIVSTVRTYLRAIAPIRNPPNNLIVSTGFAVVRPRKVEDAYLAYALREGSFVESVVARSTGVSYPACNASEVGCIPIPLPPPSEQRAIADFLDRETGKIDRLVAQKRELIEKLKEERAALISRAVTCGLNPDAKLKPSGVEWLGDVPEGWEVKRLKHMLSRPLQYGANEAADLDDPDLPRYIRITDVQEDGSLRDDTFRSLPIEVAKPYLLEDGDLLFARSGATAGKTFLYRKAWGNCAYAGYLIRARFNQRMAVPTFIKYFSVSVSYWQWLSSIYIQSTIQNVSAEKYAELMVPLPPLSEQRAIADFLDRETGKIDRLAAKVEDAMTRLQEYRAALITAAVTGKIDVRGEVGAEKPLVYPEQQSERLLAAEKSSLNGNNNY
jgi:type I restriction enzyme, S subunit